MWNNQEEEGPDIQDESVQEQEETVIGRQLRNLDPTPVSNTVRNMNIVTNHSPTHNDRFNNTNLNSTRSQTSQITFVSAAVSILTWISMQWENFMRCCYNAPKINDDITHMKTSFLTNLIL